MFKKILTIASIVLLFLALGAYFYFSTLLVNKAEERCTDLRIVVTDSLDNPLMRPKEIMSFLEAQQLRLLGNLRDSINPWRIETLLSKYATVKTCNAYTNIYGLLTIEISQHLPVMRLQQTEGPPYFLCEDGWIFPAWHSERIRLPLCTGRYVLDYPQGYRGEIKADDGPVLQLLELARLVQQQDFWRNMTAQIHIHDAQNVELITRWSGPRLLLGDLNDLKEKLHKLHRFYESIVPVKGMDYYTAVDARYDRQLVCIPEKDKKNKQPN